MFRHRLACSFCGRSEHDVDKLVAGPRVYICDRCVAIAADLMRADAPPPHVPSPPGLMSRLRHRLRGLRSAIGRAHVPKERSAAWAYSAFHSTSELDSQFEGPDG